MRGRAGLSTGSFAFTATAGRLDAPLVVLAGAKSRAKDFKPQELANTVWAFATAGLSDELLSGAGQDSGEPHW